MTAHLVQASEWLLTDQIWKLTLFAISHLKNIFLSTVNGLALTIAFSSSWCRTPHTQNLLERKGKWRARSMDNPPVYKNIVFQTRVNLIFTVSLGYWGEFLYGSWKEREAHCCHPRRWHISTFMEQWQLAHDTGMMPLKSEHNILLWFQGNSFSGSWKYVYHLVTGRHSPPNIYSLKGYAGCEAVSYWIFFSSRSH